MKVKISLDHSWLRADVIDGVRPGNVYHTARDLHRYMGIVGELAMAVDYVRYYVSKGRDVEFVTDPAYRWALENVLKNINLGL
jgi:hypothetical protein